MDSILDAERYDQINIALFLSMIRRNFILICVFAIAMAIVGCVIAYTTPKKYMAESVIAPVVDDTKSGVLGELGGLAAFAGVNVNSSSQVKKHLAIMDSLSFHQYFIKKYKVKKYIYDECWDKQQKAWVDACALAVPSDLDAARLFKEKINIRQDKAGMVFVSLKLTSPEIAVKLVNEFVNAVNQYFLEKAKQESEGSIKYFKDEISKTNEKEIKEMLYRLMEREMQTQKLHERRKSYAFEIVDKAFMPKLPVSPNRKLIIMFFTMLGIFFGVIISFVRENLPNQGKVHK